MKKILASKEYVNITIEEKINNLSASGFSGSWNDLTDKPFGESGATIVYDGNKEGLTADLSNSYVLVSRLTPSVSEVIGGKITTKDTHFEESADTPIEDTNVIELDDGYRISGSYADVYVIFVNNAVCEEKTFPQSGIYFQSEDHAFRENRFQVTNMTWGDGVKQIDEKYIPNTIARVSDIPEVPEINYPVTSVNGQTGDIVIDIPDSIPTPLTASVGQTIVVKSVDENGKPTEWECVNLPTDEHINALIDAKLADFALPSAEEVAF